MFFSAAQLSKMSAAQICYLRDKPSPAPSDRMIRGDSFADQHSQALTVEMQGCYRRGDIDLWFTIDEVRSKGRRIYLIEHKLTENAETWFFRSALIQTAFLAALAQQQPLLKTAKWKGEPSFSLDLTGQECHSVLNFGGLYYKVNADSEAVMRFFLTKARASREFTTAKRFDATYNKKEWDYFKDAIKYRKWKAN